MAGARQAEWGRPPLTRHYKIATKYPAFGYRRAPTARIPLVL